MKLLTKFLLPILIAMIGVSQVKADSITVVSTGSKTGSYTMQSVSYSKDLKKYYNVDLIIPGGHCKAIPLIKKIKTPTIIPWASDFESIGRDGIGCFTLDITKHTIIRYNRDSMRICGMNNANKNVFLQKDFGARVGHTVPTPVFARTVNAINKSFGTSHKSVSYDGNGAGRAALINGEVDYYITSPKHAKYIETNGGQCFYELSSSDKHNKLESLQDLDPRNKYLTLGYDTVWLALNMNREQIEKIKSVFKSIHNDCNSEINLYSGCGKTLQAKLNFDKEKVLQAWEQSVMTMREKND